MGEGCDGRETNNLRISKEKISVRLDAQAIAAAGSIPHAGFGKFLRSSFEAAERATRTTHWILAVLDLGWDLAGEQESF